MEFIVQIIYFVVTFILVFLLYYFITIRKELNKDNPKKKKNKNVDEAKKPVEVNYLIYRYKIDLKKISYKKLLFSIALL